jgi:hypothetical protein
MDKFDILATEASIAVSVLGNADVTDIELIRLGTNGLGTERVAELARLWAFRGLHFVGTIGIVDGKPRAAFAEALDERRMSALAQAFIAYCESLFPGFVERMQPKGDEVDFLRKLWSLADTRPN